MRRAGFPAPMYPHPLIRKAPHIVFDYLIETRRIIKDIALLVLGGSELERRLITQAVLAYSGIPVVISRNYRRSSASCQPRNSAGRGGGNAEEVCENSFGRNRVLVRQNSDDASLVKNSKNDACRLVFIDWPVPGRAAVTIHERIDTGIVDRPYQEVNRTAIKRVREWPELPSTHVACQEEDPFAPPLRCGEVSEPIENDCFFNVPARVARQACEFCRHPAQVAHHAFQNVTGRGDRQFGESQPKIEFSGSSKRGPKGEKTTGDEHADGSSHRARQIPQEFEQDPSGGILETRAHQPPRRA